MMIKPINVRALPGHRIHLEFSDGTRGEIDLSNLLDKVVFTAFKDENFFEKVHIGDHREIRWNDEIELCSDSLYLELTGKSPEDLFPALRHGQPHA
jgi:Protein of unknown function (DUF2442)